MYKYIKIISMILILTSIANAGIYHCEVVKPENSELKEFTIEITDTAGYSESKLDSVIVLQKPAPAFIANDVCYGTPISFSNTIINNGLTISSWNWKLDEVTFSTDSTPDPQNQGIGSYEIELIAIAENGCSDSITKPVRVGEIPSDNLTNNGNWSICQGDTVEFSVTNNENYSFKWLINSENIGASDTNIYRPTVGGLYSVQIKNLIGNCIDTTDQRTLTISPTVQIPLETATLSLKPTMKYCM